MKVNVIAKINLKETGYSLGKTLHCLPSQKCNYQYPNIRSDSGSGSNSLRKKRWDHIPMNDMERGTSLYGTTARRCFSSTLGLKSTSFHKSNGHSLDINDNPEATGEILPEEVSLVDEQNYAGAGSTNTQQTSSHTHQILRSVSSSHVPSYFENVRDVDTYSRARVIAFIKRYNKTVQESKDMFSITEIHNPMNENAGQEAEGRGTSWFHCSICAPLTITDSSSLMDTSIDNFTFPPEGLYAHGISATDRKEAENLACMHAERIIDFLGYHIYTLENMQRKHAIAARNAGRYAPSPDDSNAPKVSLEHFPAPLRYIAEDETEGGKWQLLEDYLYASFEAPSHALLSPCVIDPASRTRMRNLLYQHDFNLSHLCISRRIKPKDPKKLIFYESTIQLPISLIQDKKKVLAKGKAVDKDTSVVLACMHAELLLDTLNISVFENDTEQKRHAAQAWNFGRVAPLPGAKRKEFDNVTLPLPLKLLPAVSTGTQSSSKRIAVRSSEESLVANHVKLGQQIIELKKTAVLETNAVEDVLRFLQLKGHERYKDPFFHQILPNGKVRSTIVLPLEPVYGLRGGIGVGNNMAEADQLASMHALDVLAFLGVNALGDTAGTAEDDVKTWNQRRHQLVGAPVFASFNSSATTADPPPGRGVTEEGFQNKIDSRHPEKRDEQSAPQAASIKNAEDQELQASSGTMPTNLSHKKRTVKRAHVKATLHEPMGSQESKIEGEVEEPQFPVNQLKVFPAIKLNQTEENKDCWNLEADTLDGYILVDGNEKSVSVDPSLRSPRKIDPHAKSRIENYLNNVGRRFAEIFLIHKKDANEENFEISHVCVGTLPVPAQFGTIFAIGEAPTITEAEHLAAMHAELILDSLGVCIFSNPVEQERHARQCANLGRYAPVSAAASPHQTSPTKTVPPLKLAPRIRRKLKPVATNASLKAPPPMDEDDSSALAETVVKAASESDQLNSTNANEEGEEDVQLFARVLESELDQLSKSRVQYYIRRRRFLSGSKEEIDNKEFEMTTGKNIVSHTCKLKLPLPDKTETTASGTAITKRDAEILCYMHAERILDALNIPIFDNLPGLQLYHSQRVKELGRSAPASSKEPMKSIKVQAHVLHPLRLEWGSSASFSGIKKPIAPSVGTVPSSNRNTTEEQEDEIWEKYSHDCAEYINQQMILEQNKFFDIEKVPRTGYACIDEALDEVESGPPIEDIKAVLQFYCNEANTHYPSFWFSQMVGTPMHRIQYTRINVPGFATLHARGVGPNKETSERRAAAHALAILKRLDPDYVTRYASALEKRDQAAEANKSQRILELPADMSITIKSKPVKTPSKPKNNFITMWDAKAKDFTLEGKRNLINLYTICAEIDPPEEIEYVKSFRNGEPPEYRTVLKLQNEEGELIEVEGKGMGSTTNSLVAYEKLFLKLSSSSNLFTRLGDLMRNNTNLEVSSIPSLCLQDSQKEKIRSIVLEVLPLVETSDTEHASESVETVNPISTEKVKKEESFGAISLTESQQMERSLELQNLLLRKTTDNDYLTLYAKRRQNLSIAQKQKEILQAIESNQVIVICGTTGCGKTTQVPQYILDHATENNEGGKCSILVTQPRRLSAVSIAQRVAAERLESIGDACGYMIRFDSRPGKNITFCTTGILMRILHSTPDLGKVNYLIIDEIHERDIYSDFVLIMVKEILKKRKDLRVILMSATLQSDLFGNYFGNAPIINVEGYTFPVKELFLEDLASIAKERGVTSPLLKEAFSYAEKIDEEKLNLDVDDWLAVDAEKIKADTKRNSKNGPKYDVQLVKSEIDFVSLKFAVEEAARMVDLSNSSILVFLPGWEEIMRAKEILVRDGSYDIICLHSSIGYEEQLRCFLPGAEGKVKLILSTNIAESGVTIDDVGAVVDLGRTKEKSYFARSGNTFIGKDELGDISQLLTVYASRANCVQRRGRVGRTRPGVCIRLYTRDHFDNLHQFQTPEILRTPLDSLCLQVLSLKVGDPYFFLQGALEPPEETQIKAAMSRLINLGAVTETGALTTLGERLSLLPMHPRWGKIVLMGVLFQVLDPALIIASLGEQSDVFMANRDQREAARLYREHFSFDTQSDFLSSVNAYNFWVGAREQYSFAELSTLLQNRMISLPNLVSTSRCKRQFYDILVDSHFIQPDSRYFWTKEKHTKGSGDVETEAFCEQSYHSKYASDVALVKAIIASCIFPDICVVYGKRLMRSKTELRITPSTDSVVYRRSEHLKQKGTRKIDQLTDSNQNYFVYSELSLSQETKKLAARSLSHVPFWSLLLFATPNMNANFDSSTRLASINDWIFFQMSFGDFELVRKFKLCLDYCISRFFQNPFNEENNVRFAVIRKMVVELLQAEFYPNRFAKSKWEEKGKIVSPQEAVQYFIEKRGEVNNQPTEAKNSEAELSIEK